MSKPLLSICIPTFNRCEILDFTLSKLVSEDIFLNTEEIQIVISDNCSTDNTEMVCKKYTEKFPNKIKYIKQKETIFAPLNIYGVLDYADGEYLKLQNDTLYFANDGLIKLINTIKQSTADVIFCLNDNSKEGTILCHSVDDIVKEASFLITWMGAYCFNKTAYRNLDNPLKYAKQWIGSVDVLLRMIEQNAIVECMHGHILDVQCIEQKSGEYNVPEVFGKNYIGLLKKYKYHSKLSKQLFEKEKKMILLKHINPHHFDIFHRYSYNKNGYFKFLLPDYWNKPYFYLNYAYYMLRIILSHKIICRNTSKDKKLKN